jgi:argininosuccinate lyase
MKSDKLWGGRFGSDTDAEVETFTASQLFDRRLAEQDIVGSSAHARMLCHCGILSEDERDAIITGLKTILEEVQTDCFPWSDKHEDVHMNIEARLIELIGDAGKKLHTARSRNDQIATDMRLYVRLYIDRINGSISVLQDALIDAAEREVDSVMPGLTHLQNAQPVTCGHHLMAWVEMLERDWQRFRDCRKRVDVSPLGSAALAGTGFSIDREMTAKELGFASISRNSLDAVSDRDFVIEFQSAASILAVHLSRICEDLSLWASQRFGFVDLGDAFCTGSSIMPQKKNPDVIELVRGKTARVIGNLTAVLVLMKGQALAYNRDNQEDKEPLFDTVDTLLACLGILGRMIPGLVFNRDKMRAATLEGHTTATDLADYLVRKGVTFRDAHAAVGQAVAAAEANQTDLADLPLSALKSFCQEIDNDVFEVLTLDGSVQSRDHIGGTAPTQVRYQIQDARTRSKRR